MSEVPLGHTAETLMSLELSASGDLLLVCTNTRDRKGLALLVSFDGFFDLVDSYAFDQEVGSCKRLGSSDLFLVAANTSLHLLRLVGAALLPVHCFKDLTKNKIESLAYTGNDLFLLHGQGLEITHVLFDDLNLDCPG